MCILSPVDPSANSDSISTDIQDAFSSDNIGSTSNSDSISLIFLDKGLRALNRIPDNRGLDHSLSNSSLGSFGGGWLRVGSGDGLNDRLNLVDLFGLFDGLLIDLVDVGG